MKELSDLDKRVLYAIRRLSKVDANGATPTSISGYLDVTYHAATNRLKRLRDAGVIQSRSGYEVVEEDDEPGSSEHLRFVEREIIDALEGNVTGFRLELRLRRLLPVLRSAIDRASD
ncbi:MAG: hypothetical protein AAGI52_06500 [Bacteroidota bacterium]